MRRVIRPIVTILAAVTLVSLTSGSGLAATTLASGAYVMADVDQSKTIPAGWPSYSDARQCIWNDCSHLEGVAFADVDISDAMADYNDYAHFSVVNGWIGQATLWMVCSYDAGGTPIQCWYDDGRTWGLMGELSADADTLRLFPVQSAANEYHVDVYVE